MSTSARKDIYEADLYGADAFSSGIFRGPGSAAVTPTGRRRRVSEAKFAQPPDRGRFGYQIHQQRIAAQYGRRVSRGRF